MTTQPELPEGLHIGYGDRLRRLRITYGLTQDQLATDLGYSRGRVGQIEISSDVPSGVERFHRLLRARFSDAEADWVRYGERHPRAEQSTVNARREAVVLPFRRRAAA